LQFCKIIYRSEPRSRSSHSALHKSEEHASRDVVYRLLDVTSFPLPPRDDVAESRDTAVYGDSMIYEQCSCSLWSERSATNGDFPHSQHSRDRQPIPSATYWLLVVIGGRSGPQRAHATISKYLYHKSAKLRAAFTCQPQVTLCDLIWQVTLCSSAQDGFTCTAVYGHTHETLVEHTTMCPSCHLNILSRDTSIMPPEYHGRPPGTICIPTALVKNVVNPHRNYQTGLQLHGAHDTPPLPSQLKREIQGGPKNGPVWALITQRWLVVEKRVICQKFHNAVKNKRQICIVKHLHILCLICINIRHPPPRYSAKFDCNTWI